MCRKNRAHHCIGTVRKLALLSVSYVALAAAGASEVRAQATPPAEQGATQPDEPRSSPSTSATPAQEAPSASPPATPAQDATQPGASSSPASPAQQQTETPALPAVTVEAPRRRPAAPPTAQTAQVSTPLPSPPQADPSQSNAPDPSAAIQAAPPAGGTQKARTGAGGIDSNNTAVEPKINTPRVHN